MLPNNFIFSETESLFQQKLDSNEIKNTAIAFMADTGRIWTHGTWFCTALTAEDIQNLIDQSTTLQEFLQSLSPAEVSVSDTQPTGEEKIWINGNTISFNNGGSWSTPINLDNFLSKNNELEYTPVGDYNPATKKYVDDQIKANDNVLIINATDISGATIEPSIVTSLQSAIQEGKVVILKDNNTLTLCKVDYNGSDTITIHTDQFNPDGTGYVLNCNDVAINTASNQITKTPSSFNLVTNGDGLQYLSNDGTYKDFPDMATVVELNSAVLQLNSESSSEDIIAAFDSAAEFSNLIAQVRVAENIVNEVFYNDNDYIGHINASMIVSTTAEELHIRFIDNADKLVLMKITNTDGTFSCERTDKDLVNDPVELVNSGDGTKFLADDGTYKTIEAGDKTNVLILSLENDLANGQKDSPVEAEVSTALKDAISNGKACVIKSANSDILANLQQISDNVTIVMEQISRVGQTFVAVNTSITVNTATNIISDYQTGALVLETDGDGNSFLADDGTYKQVNVSDEVSISSTEPINNEKIWIDTSAEPETTQVVVKTSSNQVDFNDNVAVSMNYNNNNETKSVLGSDKVTFNVPSGTKYNILFSPAANYNTPSRIEGTADTSIKYYSANYNATNITINLVSDSGDIKDARAIINEIEYENGQTLRVASGTELVITFKEVEGFKTPAEQSITATGANMTVTGSYESESAAHENVKAKQAILFYSMIINTMSLTDEQSLEVKYLYPNWETLTDKEVDVDFKFLYGDTLYKVLQKHTISKAWIPGQGTESLYTEINETHAGTKEDPIPYNNNMELESGKYYTQDGLLYMCNINTGIPVYNKLADLVGIYVILIEE